MRSFRNLDVDFSMYYFDMAISASRGGSLAPYLWQPGISCSYLNRYSDGHKQFRLNVSTNPNDVKESSPHLLVIDILGTTKSFISIALDFPR
jgi:hypothetical protein